jgi:hypothetical protein
MTHYETARFDCRPTHKSTTDGVPFPASRFTSLTCTKYSERILNLRSISAPPTESNLRKFDNTFVTQCYMSNEMEDHKNMRLPIIVWRNQFFHHSRDAIITLKKKDVPFMNPVACNNPLCHWPLAAVEVFHTCSGCCAWRTQLARRHQQPLLYLSYFLLHICMIGDVFPFFANKIHSKAAGVKNF